MHRVLSKKFTETLIALGLHDDIDKYEREDLFFYFLDLVTNKGIDISEALETTFADYM